MMSESKNKIIGNYGNKMKTIVILLVFSAVAHAAPPIIVDEQTGKYLGTLSNNPCDQDSTSNTYGKYESEYSQDSINNPYGQYGSEYSNDSPNNPCTTNPSATKDSDGYYDYLKFTKPSATKDSDGYYDYLRFTKPSATKDSDGYYDYLRF